MSSGEASRSEARDMGACVGGEPCGTGSGVSGEVSNHLAGHPCPTDRPVSTEPRDYMPLGAGNAGENMGSDPVNHPAHYTMGGVEVIDAIEAWGLGYCLGNAVKYVARANHKGAFVQDLKKAVWYLERELARHEASDDE